MIKLNQSDNRIIINNTLGNSVFVGIVAMVMAVTGFQLLFDLLPFEEGYTFGDVFGFIFICVWISAVLGMGIYAFVTISKQIIISNDGVLCKTWFTKRYISWSEIKDWGISYCGQTKGEGNTYYLYFSKKAYPVKNECKKKLKGKMIKTFVIGSDYYEVRSKIVPFCCGRTSIEPFIGKDKYHFI